MGHPRLELVGGYPFSSDVGRHSHCFIATPSLCQNWPVSVSRKPQVVSLPGAFCCVSSRNKGCQPVKPVKSVAHANLE